jgi:hypothetical protein
VVVGLCDDVISFFMIPLIIIIIIIIIISDIE